jgi:short-subunit dehydrogenase
MPKTVVITGASSGLGLSHAIYLTHKGYSVFGTSRKADSIDYKQLKKKYLQDHTKFSYIDKDKTELKKDKILLPQEIIEKLDDYLTRITFIDMDVTINESIKKAIDYIETISQIDVLINNAGIGFFGSVEELSIEQAKFQFDVNYFGYIRVLKAIIPRMRLRKQGQIINTASLGGIVCIPFQSHYSATKAAIIRITESLRTELSPFNIKVSYLLPGDINTPFDANTVLLHDKEAKFTSSEIKDMINAIPVSENSTYFHQSRIAWGAIIRNLIVSPPPIIVSKKIEKIIRVKRPKIHYKIGSKTQTYGLTVIKRLLPESLSYKIISMFYGL